MLKQLHKYQKCIANQLSREIKENHKIYSTRNADNKEKMKNELIRQTDNISKMTNLNLTILINILNSLNIPAKMWRFSDLITSKQT